MKIAELTKLWITPRRDGLHVGRPVSATWRRTRLYLIRHVDAAIGTVEVDQLTPAHLWRMQEHCTRAGLCSESVNKITHSLFPGMLRDLVAEGIIPADVRERLRGIGRLRRDRPTTAIAYSVEDRERAIEAFRGHWAHPLVVTLMLTGLRVGEASGLTQADIDWKNGRATVHRSRCGAATTCGKTARSLRTIALPDRVLAALGALRNDHAPSEYLFRAARGEPFDLDSFRKNSWRRVLRAAGLRPLRIHDCRHTAATAMLQTGVPIAQVAAYLGNTVEMTESTYAHVCPRFDVNGPAAVPEMVERRRAHLHLVR